MCDPTAKSIRCNLCGAIMHPEDIGCRCQAMSRRVNVTISVDILCEVDGDDVDIFEAAFEGRELPDHIKEFIETECIDEVRR